MGFTVSPTEKSELMVTFAALILQDDHVEVTSDKLDGVIKAAGGKVEPYWLSLFANVLKGKDVNDLLLSGGGAPAASSAAASSGAAPEKEAKKEEKEEEKEEEEEGDMGFSLFD